MTQIGSRSIVDRLVEEPVLGDGGYLVELERRGYVETGKWLPTVVLDHPGVLRQLHQEFIRAGSEVLQALTFFANRHSLESRAGRGREAEKLNRDAVSIAREASAGQALVAGTICTVRLLDTKYRRGVKSASASPEALGAVRRELREQVGWLSSAGCDFIVAETFYRLDEAIVAVEEAKATGLPVVATMCFKGDPYTGDGFSAGECGHRLADAGADVVGVNCQRDGKSLLPLVREMRQAVSCPVAAQPLGLRTPDGWLDSEDPSTFERMQLSREEWSEFAEKAIEEGVGYIGACCGAGPSGIRGMAESLGKPTWLTGRVVA